MINFDYKIMKLFIEKWRCTCQKRELTLVIMFFSFLAKFVVFSSRTVCMKFVHHFKKCKMSNFDCWQFMDSVNMSLRFAKSYESPGIWQGRYGCSVRFLTRPLLGLSRDEFRIPQVLSVEEQKQHVLGLLQSALDALPNNQGEQPWPPPLLVI